MIGERYPLTALTFAAMLFAIIILIQHIWPVLSRLV